MANSSQGEEMQQFLAKMMKSAAYRRGNDQSFGPDRATFHPTSPLAGKKIAFLGSSVTYGFAAKGVSFVDYLSAIDGVVATKSAVSGTTLAGDSPDGYLARLTKDFSDHGYDIFVCQLSTNDNRHGKELGHVTANDHRKGFDLDTTLGAIEEICCQVHQRFGCPLVFYTCLQNDPQGKYEDLIKQLRQLQAKWGFTIIDLFHNDGLLASTAAHPNAMFDDVHPTQEGYLKIWLPVFEAGLSRVLKN